MTKEKVEGTDLGLQNREKAIHVEMEKQMSAKQMFAGPGRSMDSEELPPPQLANTPCRSVWWIALFSNMPSI